MAISTSRTRPICLAIQQQCTNVLDTYTDTTKDMSKPYHSRMKSDEIIFFLLPCCGKYHVSMCVCVCRRLNKMTHLMVMIRSVVESRDLSISTCAVEMSRIAFMLQPPRPITRLIVFAGTSSRFDLHSPTNVCHVG